MSRHIANITTTQFENMLKFFNNSIAEVFDSSSSYAVDDFVIYDGFLYQCISEVAAGSSWDASKWQIQKIFDNNGYFIFKG